MHDIMGDACGDFGFNITITCMGALAAFGCILAHLVA